MLDVSALKDVLGKTRSVDRYAAVEKLMTDHGFSERGACRLFGVNRSAWQYEPLRGKDDAVRERMRELANERHRFGYRRLAIPLRREGKGMNLKKMYQLYREERLTVRKRGGRKRALGTRAPIAIPQGLNQRWSLDSVSDALACGRRFRVLNVIDDYSRECLASIVDTSLSGRRVVRELSAIAERRGLPCMWSATIAPNLQSCRARLVSGHRRRVALGHGS